MVTVVNGRRLEELRWEYQFPSLAAFERYAGVSPGYLSKFIDGEGSCTLRTLDSIYAGIVQRAGEIDKPVPADLWYSLVRHKPSDDSTSPPVDW